MIFAFDDVAKASTDIVSVLLDWTPLLPELSDDLTVSSHSVSTKGGDVVATDEGMEGAVQNIRISGGVCESRSDVIARVVLSDGTDLSRAFRAIIR